MQLQNVQVEDFELEKNQLEDSFAPQFTTATTTTTTTTSIDF